MTDIWQAPAEPGAHPAITEAWGTLWTHACGPDGQRRDWDGPMVKAAMRETHSRGIAYKTASDTMYRLIWDLGADTRTVLGELVNLGRTTAPRADAPSSADALAAIRRGDYTAARQVMHTRSVVPLQAPASDTAPAEGDTNQ